MVVVKRRISIRIDGTPLRSFDANIRELLRTRPNSLSYDQTRRLRWCRPRPEPLTIQHRGQLADELAHSVGTFSNGTNEIGSL